MGAADADQQNKVISIHATKSKSLSKTIEDESSDSEEEENFQDVDRVLEEQKTAIKAV